jgi:hypothetical protein
MVGIGAKRDGRVLLQEAHHLGPRGQEGVRHVGTQAIADGGTQIAQHLVGIVVRHVIVRAGDPHRARGQRRGAADRRGFLDQQHTQA